MSMEAIVQRLQERGVFLSEQGLDFLQDELEDADDSSESASNSAANATKKPPAANLSSKNPQHVWDRVWKQVLNVEELFASVL